MEQKKNMIDFLPKKKTHYESIFTLAFKLTCLKYSVNVLSNKTNKL